MKLLQTQRGIYRYDIPKTESPTGRRLQGSTRTKDKAEAMQFVHAVLAGQKPQAVEGITLRQACNKALEEVWHGAKAHKFFVTGCDILCESLGDSLQLSHIDNTRVSLLKEALRNRGNSPATINRRLSVLSKLLNTAKDDWGLLQSVPKITRERGEQARTRTYTEAEEADIKDYWMLKDNEMYKLTLILFATGCRVSEALRIDPATDLLKDPYRVIIRESKNGLPRTLPITAELALVIRAGIHLRDSSEVAKRWRERLRAELGYEHDDQYVAHSIRHTVATRLIQGGYGLPKVQRWLGHKDIKTTLKYINLASADLEDGLDILSGVDSVTKTLTKGG